MTPRLSLPRLLTLLVTIGLLVALGLGCSSSQPTSAPSTAAAPSATSGPALSMLYTTAASTLVLHDARRGTSNTLVDGIESTGRRELSPSGRYLAFRYTTADSSHLALLDLRSQRLQTMHATTRPVVHSLAWHPEQDRLAFGHYRPTEGDGRGPGGLQVATPNGSTRTVGCSTVREVLHWLPGETLATRTDDNLYAVAAEGCATQASLDARRMHHIRYAPTGQQMAYIHRELRYDREAGEYVPDSSLVLSGPQGQDAETLFQDKRHARHSRWSPNGTELALDVRVEASGHRQVVVYDGSRPAFLVPPPNTSADQVHPRWSPSGDRIAFTLRTDDAAYAAVRVKGQTRRLSRTQGPVWGWLDDRSVVVPGPDSVRVQTLNGTTRFTHPSPRTLLHVWRRPAS